MEINFAGLGRLVEPGKHDPKAGALVYGARWPLAAWGGKGKIYRSPISMWPIRAPYGHLLDTVDHRAARPLSNRAAKGFLQPQR